MQLTIEKLIFGGQGLAKKDGKTYLVWNALPGETVRARIVNKARSVYEAIAEEILNPSLERVPAAETHYLSCGPWQTLAFEAENKWKQKIASETYEKLGGLKIKAPPPIVFDAREYGYRNKMEYNFLSSPSGTSLAFFERNSNTKLLIDDCLLADEAIRQNTRKILDWLRKEGPHEHCLQNLVLRSDGAGGVIGGLFLSEAIGVKTHPPLDNSLVGFHIHASGKLIHSAGEKSLTIHLSGAALEFGLFSFFQINTPLFEKALDDMRGHIDWSAKLVDFYSGVGAVGIGLGKNCKNLTMVESGKEAFAYAKKNSEQNSLKNCRVILSSAEKMTALIESDAIIIFDPPRAGLDSKIIQKVLSARPFRVLYLSCDIATHARDIKLLSSGYRLRDLKLYNFFPRTPHLESLAVLDRI
jgi:23S rRNA (uracil1939-C5)-methyltransferase